MPFPNLYPDFEPCDGCGASVGAQVLHKGLMLCVDCLREAYEAEARTEARLPRAHS